MEMLHIICFGNSWHGNDGFGIAVYNKLKAQDLPNNVVPWEGGTLGLNATRLFEGCATALVVDAMLQTDKPEGSLVWLTGDDVVSNHAPGLIGHHSGVADILKLLPLAYDAAELPEVRVLACTVHTVEPASNTLSPAVARAVDKAVDALLLMIRDGRIA